MNPNARRSNSQALLLWEAELTANSKDSLWKMAGINPVECVMWVIFQWLGEVLRQPEQSDKVHRS